MRGGSASSRRLTRSLALRMPTMLSALLRAINRAHARKWPVDDLRENLAGGRIDFEHEDAIARRHDVAHAARGKLEHAMNHHALRRLDLAEVFAQPQQRLELSFGNRRGTRRFDVGDEVARNRTNDTDQHRQRSGGNQCDAAGKTEGESLRRDVAKEQHQREHHRHGQKAAVGTEPGEEENRPEAFGENVRCLVQVQSPPAAPPAVGASDDRAHRAPAPKAARAYAPCG